MNAQCKHCTLQPAPAEPTPPPATPTTKRRGRTKTDPSPRIAAKPPTLPVLAHPAKPWHLHPRNPPAPVPCTTHTRSCLHAPPSPSPGARHLRPALIALCNEYTMQSLHSATRTRGTRTLSSLTPPAFLLRAPPLPAEPPAVSWSLHHTLHPRSPTYPGVNHHTCTYLLISAITTRSSRTPPPPNAAKPPTPPSPGISTRGTRPINPCRLHPFLLPRGKPKNHRPLQPLPAEPTA